MRLSKFVSSKISLIIVIVLALAALSLDVIEKSAGGV